MNDDQKKAIIARLTPALMEEEGFRQYPYLDTMGFTTIGYGRNLNTVGISRDEGGVLLRNDIQRAMHEIGSALTWTRELDPVRLAILIDMDFNLGLKSLLKFKRTLLLIREKNFEAASKEMLDSTWAKQVQDRAARLSAAMKTGEWW